MYLLYKHTEKRHNEQHPGIGKAKATFWLMRTFILVPYTPPSLIIWASNYNWATEAVTPTANQIRLKCTVVFTDWLVVAVNHVPLYTLQAGRHFSGFDRDVQPDSKIYNKIRTRFRNMIFCWRVYLCAYVHIHGVCACRTENGGGRLSWVTV